MDYLTGDIVEWRTNYAYGADESGWKNPNPIYDNADEPYGFTGKEEDVEIGLHYFGARYYSSYTARWLGPDPPVVHGGGMTNYFAYGGNSPYIYVDPDGNFIQAIIGAIVGAVVGAVTAAINGGGWDEILAGAVIGALTGAITGGVSAGVIAAGGTAAAGVIAGAATSAACNMAVSAAYGASGKQILISGAISFGTGLVSGAIGSAIGTMGNQAGQAIAGYASSLAVSYGATALSGGLNEDTWDDVLLSSSISYWGSYAGSTVGAEIRGAGGDNSSKSTISESGSNNRTYEGEPQLTRTKKLVYEGEFVGQPREFVLEYRELSTQERIELEAVYQRIQDNPILLENYPLLQRLEECPVYIGISYDGNPFNSGGMVVQKVNGMSENVIYLNANLFGGSDNDLLTAVVLGEFQHTGFGNSLTDNDIGADGRRIVQQQLIHMTDLLGIDPSTVPIHGIRGYALDSDSIAPSSPVRAYRRNGVLYHDAPGGIWLGWDIKESYSRFYQQ